MTSASKVVVLVLTLERYESILIYSQVIES
jgi:hypothetical protein